MDYNVFVIISTIVFYIVMLVINSNNQKKEGNVSPLIYALLVPAILYGYKYMTMASNDIVSLTSVHTPSITEIMSEQYPLNSSSSQ